MKSRGDGSCGASCETLVRISRRTTSSPGHRMQQRPNRVTPLARGISNHAITQARVAAPCGALTRQAGEVVR